MFASRRVLIVIPARAGSTRLPNKPLVKFHGKTLIQHVWNKANRLPAKIIVATDSDDIVKEVESFGGTAMMTDSNIQTGSDRVAQVYKQLGQSFDAVINLQGDMPFITPRQIASSIIPLNFNFDVGTLIYKMDEAEQNNPNSVKAIATVHPTTEIGQCHWFLRAPLSYGYHHAGIYAFKPEVLKQLARLEQTELEQIEKLEQLRFLENKFRIGGKLCEAIKGEINTYEDLEMAKAQPESKDD